VGAKETFEFSPCFEDFQCAKLKLPLDYFNGTYANESVSLAIIKLPAKVPIDDPRYGGPVLLNPGGPGGSGVALALLQGKQIQIIIDPASGSNGESKYYDIIGFDPRGIGYTEPPARCMPDMASSWSWRLRVGTEGMLGSSNAALGRLWSMTHAFGTSCKEASDANDGPDIKKYISTASVARDMLEIAEKHADWVAEKTAGLSVSRDVSDKKTVKLQYWGFSYGTYLGATFAALFPDRVGRVVLDGVVNVHDYNNALGQGSLHDTERNMHSFYTFCKGAGGELCPLALSSSSTENIEQRVKKIIGSLYHNPITITTAEHGPDIFTYTDLMAIIFSALYTPTYAFTFVAKILSDVENRGGPTLDSLTRNFIPTHVYQCPIGNSSLHIPWDTNVPGTSILCGDGIDQSPTTLEAFEEYWHLLNGISPSAGSLWAMLKMQCTAWKIRPLFRFGDDENFYGNTSYPILWISTTADPVTPLRSARIMQERFPGSGLLVQDSAGHCSISTPTPCSILRIREYFQRGALPDENTVCIPPPSPWSLNSTDSSSPFYDPSLGQPVYLTEEGYEEEMTAARDLQLWAIDHDFLGRHLAGPRVKSMMTSISAKDWVMVNGIDEIVI
ncbi:alpha/beta-hydrolase, partial [Massarina eburnea CBS 473.64]